MNNTNLPYIKSCHSGYRYQALQITKDMAFDAFFFIFINSKDVFNIYYLLILKKYKAGKFQFLENNCLELLMILQTEESPLLKHSSQLMPFYKPYRILLKVVILFLI